MNTALPALSMDAIIDVAREGGFAYIPKLAGPRRFTLAQLSTPQREHVCSVLQQALPLGKEADESGHIGSGDRRYFRVEISYSNRQQPGCIVVVIPEEVATNDLVKLWQNGL